MTRPIAALRSPTLMNILANVSLWLTPGRAQTRGFATGIGVKADVCAPAVDPTLGIECTPQGPAASEPVDHRKPERVGVVHGGEHGAGLLQRHPAGHQPARVDAPDGDKLHFEMLDRPV